MKLTFIAAALVCAALAGHSAHAQFVEVMRGTTGDQHLTINGGQLPNESELPPRSTLPPADQTWIAQQEAQNAFDARQKAIENLKHWREPGSISLCPKPHRMTEDGCQ